MEALTTDLTWEEIENRFNEDGKYSFSLKQHKRRANLTKRKKGDTEERNVWRLLIQKDDRSSTKTLFKKNIDEDDIEDLSDTPDEAILQKINAVIQAS